MLIKPTTKVAELLDSYPELEQALIDLAPPFKNLKNPILRKTVGRVATLQNAAVMGNVELEKLVNYLREKVGQPHFTGHLLKQYNLELPDWYAKNKIVNETSVSDLIDAGQAPLEPIMHELKKLDCDKIFKLMAPFLPAPFIDQATNLGFSHWVERLGETVYIIYFHKPRQ